MKGSWPRAIAAALLVLALGAATARAQQSAPAAAQPATQTATQPATPAADAPPVPAPGAEPFNSLCPVLTDEAVVRKYTVNWRGVNVGLCCAKCQKKFLANPQAYAAHLPPLPAGVQPVAAMPAAGAAPPAPPAPADAEPEQGPLAGLFGRFHVLIVHFPIALLLAGALAELLSSRRARASLSAAAHFCVYVAAVMAPITALAGIVRAEGYSTVPGQEETLQWHRYSGIATAALAILVAFLGWRARRQGAGPGAARAFRWGLVVAALLVGLTAHFGGELVHGAGYPFE